MKTHGKKFLSIFAIALIAIFSLTSCEEDDDTMNDMLDDNLSSIVTLASSDANLSTLVEALTMYPDLVSALSGDGNFTVFAPTNDAFEALLDVIGQSSLEDVPEDVIERILKYHVISGAALMSTDLSDGQMAGTLLSDDDKITVSIEGSSVMINNANVTTADIEADNGIIHVIDAVLVPALELSIVNTIVEPAYFNEDFSILTEAVVTAGLLNVLIDTEANYTLFAPDNDAFEEAGITSLEGLTANDLTPILTYHVLSTEVFADGLPISGSAVETLNGKFYLSINDNGVFINGLTEVIVATVADGALDYDNGVVHVIDRTLVPASQNVVEIAVAASEASEGAEFTQLVAALTAAELTTALSGDGPFTVFAPTDEAFQTLYDAVGDVDEDGDNDISDLVEAAGMENITNVLLYHVLSARVFSTDIPNLLGDNSSVSIDLQLLDASTWDLNSDLTITPTDAVLGIGLDDAEISSTDIFATNGVIHVIDQVILP